MRRVGAVALIASLAIAGALAVALVFIRSVGDGEPEHVVVPTATPACSEFAQGRLWVQGQHGVTEMRVAEIVERFGATILSRHGGRVLQYGPTGPYYAYPAGTYSYILTVPPGEELALIPQLEALPEIESARLSCLGTYGTAGRR